MSYKLFLDDERLPVDENEFVIVRNFNEFVDVITTLGSPNYISFDHDLGQGKTGLDAARWLIEYDLDYDVITKDFRYFVHSQNPVGAANISGLFDGYLAGKFKEYVVISDL